MRTRLLPLLSLAVLVTGVPAAAPTAAEGASGRPTVASISPRIGSTQARQHVTIRGSGFSHVRTVRFGHRRAARVVVLNGRTMVAYAPAQSHGVRDVTVRTSAGTSRRVRADRYD